MEKIPQGTYVEITKEVLPKGERAPQVPSDTQNTPLLLKVKGFLQTPSIVGEEVEIKTVLGRKITGVLTNPNPRYTHDFGDVVPQLFKVRESIKNFMKSGDGHGQ
ncbi:hypothetical protein SAMN02745227_00958 [Anaerobranca californiensis DSM 14826]|jgi:hypothetical protein|uniref:2-amino-4-ketopentanoate thiolase alpha subunit n=1 Tax=Anaerobranca californiensis DSM 14826 TaxID=1120989 RepID=A0A1M6MYP2_9FIRM|nr:2-amino-4-oxopentanoate thiolase subunit OrtA [Anaerobranca californiensis]SHJ88532.1 hypothetical protein SAMN02745227_00958 [Anaerobranca californiensis DSM 14826]